MPRITLKRRIREIWQKLAVLDAAPNEIAVGFSIGIASSFVPLNPSPIIVATAVAWLARCNVFAAVGGATLAILYTPLLPLIWLLEYRVGKIFLPVHFLAPDDWGQIRDVVDKGWDAYAAMFIGSIVIAAPFTVLSYLVVKWLAERSDRRKKASRPPD